MSCLGAGRVVVRLRGFLSLHGALNQAAGDVLLEEKEEGHYRKSSQDGSCGEDAPVFGALLCDIGMPHEDGYSLIARIRALEATEGGTIPAIALTGYVRVEERMRALMAGYQMFVPKPVEADELASIITSLVGRADSGVVADSHA